MSAPALPGSQPMMTPTDTVAMHRLGSMVGQLLEELRIGGVDSAGLCRAQHGYRAALAELAERLDPQLAAELLRLTAMAPDTSSFTESELRILQAQLLGWLEGNFAAIEFAAATGDCGRPDPSGADPTNGDALRAVPLLSPTVSGSVRSQ